MRAVYPLTEAHVLSTCAASGLIGGWVSLLSGVRKQLYSVFAVSVLRLESKNPAVELARQLLRSAFSSSHELFLVARGLMFIPPGMSSPALSHRFHTFLLANLTVLLPAAESQPGMGESPFYCCCRQCCCSLTHAAWGGGGHKGRRKPFTI